MEHYFIKYIKRIYSRLFLTETFKHSRCDVTTSSRFCFREYWCEWLPDLVVCSHPLDQTPIHCLQDPFVWCDFFPQFIRCCVNLPPTGPVTGTVRFKSKIGCSTCAICKKHVPLSLAATATRLAAGGGPPFKVTGVTNFLAWPQWVLSTTETAGRPRHSGDAQSPLNVCPQSLLGHSCYSLQHVKSFPVQLPSFTENCQRRALMFDQIYKILIEIYINKVLTQELRLLRRDILLAGHWQRIIPGSLSPAAPARTLAASPVMGPLRTCSTELPDHKVESALSSSDPSDSSELENPVTTTAWLLGMR